MKIIIVAAAILLMVGCTTIDKNTDKPGISAVNPIFDAISSEITVKCERDDGKKCVDMR